MRIIDPHIHCTSRVTDDYEKMALAGIEAVIEPAFWLGQPRTNVGSFIDYFDHIIEFERQRAAQYGIQHFCCIALNPREANNVKLSRQVLPVVEKYLSRESVVALGEIGFDRQTDEEEKAIRLQLRMAKKQKFPVLIHLPHQFKKIGTERTLKVVKEEKMNPDLVVLDHNTEETLPLYAGTRYWRGITCYPITKMSVDRTANVVQQYGVKRLLINSSADWGHSDPLSVPRCVVELRKRGVPDEQIEQLVYHNPIEFFGQSKRLILKKRS